MSMVKGIVCAGVSAIAAIVFPLSTAAADFPSKPVQILVSTSAGGPADTFARLLASGLSARWKVPVVVENKPGADGALAASAALNAPRDGSTLLFTITAHIQAVGFNAKLNYDPVADFMPITQIAVATQVLMVREGGPKTLAEFISAAKVDSSNMSYASPSTTSYIYGELLNRAAKINVINVSYKGGAPATAALIGGHASASFVEGSQARTHARSGKLQPLAVLGAHRYSQLPEVKTFAELGYPGFELLGWHGLLVAKDTPKDVAARISADVRDVMKEPAVHARFAQFGVDPVGSTPEEWGAVLKDETARWTALIKSTGVKRQ